MPKATLTGIDISIARFRTTVTANMPGWTDARDPQAFASVEQAAHAAARKLADDIVAVVLREILADPAFQAQCSAGARSVGGYRSKGFKRVFENLATEHPRNSRESRNPVGSRGDTQATSGVHLGQQTQRHFVCRRDQ